MILTWLRKLSINLVYKDVKNLFGIINNMKNFERLSVSVLNNEEEIADLKFVTSPSQCLEQFDLDVYIKKILVWVCKLENLIRL